MQSTINIFGKVCEFLKIHRGQREITQQGWSSFHDELLLLPACDPTLAQHILAWVANHQESHEPERFRYRILHELEKEMLSPAAYGFLTYLVHLGVLTWDEVDEMIESHIARDVIPINRQVLEKEIANNWLKSLRREASAIN